MWSRFLDVNLIFPQTNKKFPTFYGTRKVITLFIGFRHLSVSGDGSIQSTPSQTISLRSILTQCYVTHTSHQKTL